MVGVAGAGFSGVGAGGHKKTRTSGVECRNRKRNQRLTRTLRTIVCIAGRARGSVPGAVRVFRPYSAFLTSMHPIPLGALQKPAGGLFPAVLSVLRGLDVYAEGMKRSGNGCSAFGCLAFCLWENWMLGGTLCAGRSPDLQDTKCLPGGFWFSPLGGLVFMRAWRSACVARARFLKNT